MTDRERLRRIHLDLFGMPYPYPEHDCGSVMPDIYRLVRAMESLLHLMIDSEEKDD